MYRLAAVATSFLRLFRAKDGSRFRQNFLSVAKANILVQIMSLAMAPLLTRLYSPRDYGTASLFASLLGFLAGFATLRFEWSIPNAPAHARAAALLWLSLVALLVTSIVSPLVWFPLLESVGLGDRFHELAKFSVFIPIALLGTGIQQVLLGWYTRENDLAAVSQAQVRQGIAGSALSITGGVLGLGPLGLIGSAALSAWAGIGILLKRAPSLPRGLTRLTRAEVADAFKKSAGESAISSAVSIVNIAGTAAIPFVLVCYYGPAEVGWYALMNRLAQAPTQLFTNALARSFWAEAARLIHTDRPALRRLYVTTAKRLALAAIPVTILCIGGPVFVAPVFGHEWQGAGTILLALAPGVVAQLIAQPITHLIVHRKQHWKLQLDAGKLAAILGGATFLAGRKVEIQYVVWWLSTVQVLTNAILFYLNLRCVTPNKEDSR